MDETGVNKLDMTKRVVTVEFTKGEAAILGHVQRQGDNENYRWLFNTQQVATQNGLAVPEGLPPEFTAETTEERDQLAEQLLDAVLVGRSKITELAAQVDEAFANALPEAPNEEPSPSPLP